MIILLFGCFSYILGRTIKLKRSKYILGISIIIPIGFLLLVKFQVNLGIVIQNILDYFDFNMNFHMFKLVAPLGI